MKRSGYWATAPGVGAFTDTSIARRDYQRAHATGVYVHLLEIQLITLGYPTKLALYFADAAYDIPFNGVVYRGGGQGQGWRFTRDKVTTEVGFNVASSKITIPMGATQAPLPPADGDPGTYRFTIAEAMDVGVFDGARVTVRRLLLPDHPTYPIGPSSIAPRGDLLAGDTSLGAVHVFEGDATEGDGGRAHAVLDVKARLQRATVGMPRNVYQPGCANTLYDVMCGVDPAGSTGGIGHGADAAVVYAADSPPGWVAGPSMFLVKRADGSATFDQPPDYFTLGTAEFQSGALAGFKTPVVEWAHTVLLAGPLNYYVVATLYPLPRFPENGALVRLQGGCDKVALLVDAATGAVTDGTCETKYGNLHRTDGRGFRGFPHTPPEDTAF